jgi:SAM-dependent methyltransferase
LPPSDAGGSYLSRGLSSLSAANLDNGPVSRDAYAAIAALYDFAYWDFTDDVDFYANMARINDGPVLELGAGTGRVAVRLAQAGFSVTGIDASPSMLARGRENARRARVPAKRLRLVQGGMTDFELDERFGTAVVAANTFQHLMTANEQRGCLARIAAHTAPGAIVAISIHSPASVPWDQGGASPSLRFDWVRTDPETGDLVTKMVASEADPARMVRHLTYLYDRAGKDGVLRRTVFETELRYSSQAEMELLLQEAGLHVTHVYGDYDLTPVGPDTEQLIFVARAGSPS